MLIRFVISVMLIFNLGIDQQIFGMGDNHEAVLLKRPAWLIGLIFSGGQDPLSFLM